MNRLRASARSVSWWVSSGWHAYHRRRTNHPLTELPLKNARHGDLILAAVATTETVAMPGWTVMYRHDVSPERMVQNVYKWARRPADLDVDLPGDWYAIAIRHTDAANPFSVESYNPTDLLGAISISTPQRQP